ncbi:hypothetical protein [Pyrobaculum aerophilum]|uniref:Thiamine-binding protein domain-containing protein n=1 Tax=Pyrobaculum aerophilum TaxID=13773 RepID=A0A371R481_9CREN|nr:hypothetical protein [Pyrobaculum aerophilum]RFA96192.1 hypothetical protein CGL51_05885 [Pyrobaculum aerophilum]RFA98599.1 hypothetical protein CGL52_06675 [Pyrobaculum aerophilum]
MKARLVIGFEMLEGSSEQVALDLVAGMLARKFGLAPEWSDAEGLVYEVDSSECGKIVTFVKEYLDAIRGVVRVRFEGWAKIRKPDIIACREEGEE